MTPQTRKARETTAVRYALMILKIKQRARDGFCSQRTANSHIASYWGTVRWLELEAEVEHLLARRRRYP